MEDFKAFWEAHGRDIVLGVIGVCLLRTNKRVNDVSGNVTKLARQTKSAFDVTDANMEQLFKFKSDCWDNFEIIQKDINKVATHVGFKGRLGVNE